MAAKTLVPITGSVLRWAIKEAGFSEEELAHRAGTTVEDLSSWEEGTGYPSKTQFGKLADALRRPRALFFLPTPPVNAGLPTSFRQAPGLKGHTLSPTAIRQVRAARRLQEGASWVLKHSGDSARVNLPRFSTADRPAGAAEEVRRSTGITFDDQLSWPSASAAYREWRQVLEDMGVLVFSLQLGAEEIRGFSAWDDYAPLVATNSTYIPAARLYTMAHELGHLVTRTDSACYNFVAPNRPGDPKVERWCEEFAAALLLPGPEINDFLHQRFGITRGTQISDFELVRKIAAQLKVSVRAMAIKLIRLGFATTDLYAEVEQNARKIDRPNRAGGGGQPTVEKRLSQYGSRLPSVLIEAARGGLIGQRDAAEYLQVNLGQLQDLTSILDTGARE
jgi:Zn-dependent peptidase ImmA (M78 family)/transcriptional regulator with XRE-family HTH domain